MMNRISKDEYYLSIADVVLKRSTCLRRNYGVVIVKNDEIVATGYNGAARGEPNCCDTGTCARQALVYPAVKDTNSAWLSTQRTTLSHLPVGPDVRGQLFTLLAERQTVHMPVHSPA